MVQFVVYSNSLWGIGEFGAGAPHNGIAELGGQRPVQCMASMLHGGPAAQNDPILRTWMFAMIWFEKRTFNANQDPEDFLAFLCKSGSVPDIPTSELVGVK